MSTDKDWQSWGQHNPYYGVISNKKYAGKKLNPSTEKDFYLSGFHDIGGAMALVRKLNQSNQRPAFRHAVDFGCGAGRLVIPLTGYADRVTGIDVSPSILRLAHSKVPKNLRGRISFRLSDDQLKVLPKNYDLIHSYIVLQHIHPKRGMKLIDIMIDRLQPGGVVALHIAYDHEASRLTRLVVWLRNHILPIHYLLNIMRGRPVKTPRMRMHKYSLPVFFDTLAKYGIEEFVTRPTNHGGYKGIMVVGRKPKNT